MAQIYGLCYTVSRFVSSCAPMLAFLGLFDSRLQRSDIYWEFFLTGSNLFALEESAEGRLGSGPRVQCLERGRSEGILTLS